MERDSVMHTLKILREGKDNVCQLEYKNQYYVIDLNRCMYLEVNKKLYDCITIIKSCKSIDTQAMNTYYFKELDFLIKAYEKNFLFVKSCITEKEAEYATLSFIPEHRCNFNCRYCFAKGGESYSDSKKNFEKLDIEKTLNCFFNIFSDISRYRIDFVSGGEPLLYFDAIKYTIEYAERFQINSGKRVQIWLCTNGSLLTKEIVHYLNKHNVSIGISIDGDELSHNANRIYHNGKGTYNDVIRGLQTVLSDEQVSTKMRHVWGLCVINEENCNLIEIVQHYKRVGILVAQMKVEWKSFDCNEEMQQFYDVMKDSYERFAHFLFEEYKNSRMEYFFMIINDNDQFGKILKRFMTGVYISRRCEAGRYKITVCPNGDIYPCYGFIGYDAMKLGNINQNKIDKELFRHVGVNDSEKCRECGVKYFCGGDCYYNTYLSSKSLGLPNELFCEFQRWLCEIGIWLICEMRKYNNEQYQKLEKEIIHCDKIRKQ